jgi:predicted SprT family Zn-dependent metalloprotease
MTNHQPSHNDKEIGDSITSLCNLWEIQKIQNDIQVEFSSRMTRSLGRTLPTSKIIRLNKELLGSLHDYMQEVLCHELAHIASVYKFGEAILPHGREWQSLVLQAGYIPRVKMDVAVGNVCLKPTQRFRHTCPVCFSTRIAKKQIARWRCSRCVTNGLDGKLLIERIK